MRTTVYNALRSCVFLRCARGEGGGVDSWSKEYGLNRAASNLFLAMQEWLGPLMDATGTEVPLLVARLASYSLENQRPDADWEQRVSTALERIEAVLSMPDEYADAFLRDAIASLTEVVVPR